MKINTFATHFADITDPRQFGKIEHKLFDIILLTISAVVSGAEGWEDIEMFGEERLDWLRLYGALSMKKKRLKAVLNKG